jgi:HSP20 family protein
MSTLNETLTDPSHPISTFLSQNGLKLTKANKSDNEVDFEPTVDVFDTENSFIVHVSLPGAVKEDVGLHYDAVSSREYNTGPTLTDSRMQANNELEISGVIYRPGDEEFLKKLVVTERQVGLFNRKVKFGKAANGLLVEVDDITAKLDSGKYLEAGDARFANNIFQGILQVTIPKREKETAERRKVQIV